MNKQIPGPAQCESGNYRKAEQLIRAGQSIRILRETDFRELARASETHALVPTEVTPVCTEGFERWEIINRVGNLVDWSPTSSAILTATELAA